MIIHSSDYRPSPFLDNKSPFVIFQFFKFNPNVISIQFDYIGKFKLSFSTFAEFG